MASRSRSKAKVRQDAHRNALMPFGLEMKRLGLLYAMVVVDPKLQTEEEAVITFGGNVTKARAVTMMRRWTEGREAPASKVLDYLPVAMPNGEVN